MPGLDSAAIAASVISQAELCLLLYLQRPGQTMRVGIGIKTGVSTQPRETAVPLRRVVKKLTDFSATKVDRVYA